MHPDLHTDLDNLDWKITCATPPRGATTPTTSPSPSHVEKKQTDRQNKCCTTDNEVRNLIRGTACIGSFRTIAPRGDETKKNIRQELLDRMLHVTTEPSS